MKKSFNTRQLTILGLLTGILLLMAYTPLGYLNIGILAISFNVIPVALAAVTLGPAGGAAAGAVFGLTSFLQCIGVGGASPMGVILFEINPVLAFIQRFFPRLLDGFLLGYIFRFVRKSKGARAGCFVTGFFSAFLNTLFFMTALIVLYGNTEYLQGLIGGRISFCLSAPSWASTRSAKSSRPPYSPEPSATPCTAPGFLRPRSRKRPFGRVRQASSGGPAFRAAEPRLPRQISSPEEINTL